MDPLVRGTDPRIRIRTKVSRISDTGLLCIPGAGEGWEEGGTPDGPEVVVDCAQVTGRTARQVVRP
jgi:hypothetical protein